MSAPVPAPVLGAPAHAFYGQKEVAVLPLGNPTLTYYQDLAPLRNTCGAPKSFMDAAPDPGMGPLSGPTWDSFAQSVLACGNQPNPSTCVSSAVMNFVAQNQSTMSGPQAMSRVYPSYGQTYPGAV